MVAVCFQEPDSWFGPAKNLHWNHWRHSYFFRCQIDLRTWSWHVNWPLWDIKVYKNISWFMSNLESEVTSPTLPCRVLSLAMPTHCSRHTKFMVSDCCDYETLGGTMNGREIGAIRATRQRSNQQLEPWGGWCQDVPPKSFSVYWDGSSKSCYWLCSKPSLAILFLRRKRVQHMVNFARSAARESDRDDHGRWFWRMRAKLGNILCSI